MINRRIKAVLFDLGETLLVFGKVDRGKLFKEAAELSYSFLNQSSQPVGSYTMYFLRHLMSIRLRYFLSNITGNDFDSLALLKKIGSKMGFTLSAEQWAHLSWLWYQPLGNLASVEPDMAGTLARLKGLGLKLGIVSNTFIHQSTLEKHLEQLELLDFFSLRMYSYQFCFRKPDKRIFLAAAEKIGVEPCEVMFVGDKIGYDIKGARRAEMFGVLKKAYTNAGQKTPEGVLKISNLSELGDIIEKINGKRE